MADYIDTGTYAEAGRRNKVSPNTVKTIVLQERETAKKCAQKKAENTVAILDELGKQVPKVTKFCDLAVDRMVELAPDTKDIRALATALGIAIDKYTALPVTTETDMAFDMPARVIAPAFQPVFLSLVDEEYREYELAGGRGSGKSSFVALAMVWLLRRYPNMHAVCLRKVGNTLRGSVFAQIRWAIGILGLEAEFSCTVSPMEIALKATGQKIYFRGADDPHKLKSVTPPFGYIGLAWFEELDQFGGEAEVRNILQSVIRGGDKAFCFLTYNPPQSASNWVNRAQGLPKPGRLLHKSTYTEVPRKWLGQPFIDEAEFLKEINPHAYEHEYLGIANGTGGAVFENVVQQAISDDDIKGFDRVYTGLDWGFYPDPFAWDRMYYDPARLTLYIYDELRLHKKGNEETARILREEKGVTADELIIADSADPKSIQDYRNYGFYCRGVEKGAGSVAYSMKWLQRLKAIVIDPVRCPNTAKEFMEYEYERTKDGEIISGYPDKNNHHIDAVRYAMWPVWRRKGQ